MFSKLNSGINNYLTGGYCAVFKYAGYNSGAFLFLPKYILDKYDIFATSFSATGFFSAISVDGVVYYTNGIMFYHTWDAYHADYSGISCEVQNVTFTPKTVN